MKIIKINPFKQPQMVEAIASVYQKTFGGDPWNEGYRCPMCEKVFPRVPKLNLCPQCIEGSQSILTIEYWPNLKVCPICVEQRSQTVLMVEYWPMSKIISDFYSEMMKPDSVCVVAQSEGGVIGFTWGYRVSANPDLDEQLEAPNLHQVLQGDFFYGDECALLPDWQGKGIGKLLVSHILSEQHQKQILIRTMNNSRMCNLIKRMGGEIIQEISRGRIIMKLIIS